MRLAIGSLIVTMSVLAAILAPLITPYSPSESSLLRRNIPPFWSEQGTVSHPIGTDRVGRDVWAEVVYGVRTTLIAVLAAVAAGGILGASLGFIFGYYPGTWDGLYNFAVPTLIKLILWAFWLAGCLYFALILLSATGVIFVSSIIVLGVMICPRTIGAVRNMVKLQRFPEASKTLPGWFISEIALMIILHSLLSFLVGGGFADSTFLGELAARGRNGPWWNWTFPAVCIILMTTGFYLLGSWFRSRPASNSAESCAVGVP